MKNLTKNKTIVNKKTLEVSQQKNNLFKNLNNYKTIFEDETESLHYIVVNSQKGKFLKCLYMSEKNNDYEFLNFSFENILNIFVESNSIKFILKDTMTIIIITMENELAIKKAFFTFSDLLSENIEISL